MIDNNTLIRIKKGNELEKKKKIIESSQGYKIWLALMSRRMSYLIFLENFRLLNLKITYLNSPEIFHEQEEIRKRKQRKLVRDIYNAINSAFSFQDHLINNKESNSVEGLSKVSVFFRYIRNFITHSETFPLVSRKTSLPGGKFRIYQTMKKEKFQNYLQGSINHYKTIIQDKKSEKKIKQAETLLFEVEGMSEYIDFQPLLNDYYKEIVCIHHKRMKKIIKNNTQNLKNLISEVTDFNILVNEYHKENISSLKDNQIYWPNNMNILTNVELRYLKILTGKKTWNQKMLFG